MFLKNQTYLRHSSRFYEEKEKFKTIHINIWGVGEFPRPLILATLHRMVQGRKDLRGSFSPSGFPDVSLILFRGNRDSDLTYLVNFRGRQNWFQLLLNNLRKVESASSKFFIGKQGCPNFIKIIGKVRDGNSIELLEISIKNRYTIADTKGYQNSKARE